MVVENIFIIIFMFSLATCVSEDEEILSPSVKSIVDEMSWKTRVHVVPYLVTNANRRRSMSNVSLSTPSGRRIDISNITQEELEVIGQRFTKLKNAKAENDEYMKRADKIKALYVNNPVFKIGFLQGQLDDKMHLIYNITYIAHWMRWWYTTLEWVTAYEELFYIDKEVADIIKWMKEQNEKADEDMEGEGGLKQ